MPLNHPHGGHRARLRARFEKDPNSLEDHELLELLLFYGIPQKDTNGLSHNLMNHYGSLSGVLDTNLRQLKSFPGLGETSAVLIPVVLEVVRRYCREKSERKPPAVYDPKYIGVHYLSTFFGKTEESVIAIALGSDLSIKGDVCIGRGNFRSSPVDTVALTDFISGMRPCYIVLAHNHPSGIGLPSQADFESTDSLREFISKAGSKLLDHLIFDGNGDFVSLRDSNQMYKANRHNYVITRSPDIPDIFDDDFYTLVPLVAEIMTKDQTNGDNS